MKKNTIILGLVITALVAAGATTVFNSAKDFLSGVGDTEFEISYETELPRLMSNRTLEDGTKVLELNLAGFKDEEINLQVDEAKHELHVKAERTAEDDAHAFSCTVPLSQYNTAEDVKVKYEYGVLTITISSGADRKQASLVQIELGK